MTLYELKPLVFKCVLVRDLSNAWKWHGEDGSLVLSKYLKSKFNLIKNKQDIQLSL